MTAADSRSAAATRRAGLWAAGFRPVAVFNYDAEGASPGKRPVGKAWEKRARRTPPEAAEAAPEMRALNTGILCDGLRAVDLDVDDTALAGRLRAMAEAMFGPAPVRTRANSPRALLVYRAAEGEPVKRAVKGTAGKVEILGRGQQFVAFGLHETGAALEWPNGAPGGVRRDELPTVTEAQVTAFLDAAAPLIGGAAPTPAPAGQIGQPAGMPEELAPLSGVERGSARRSSALGPTADPKRVAKWLATIPNGGPPDWEHWNRVGMAAWAATRGSAEGFEAWNAWSELNDAHDPAEAAARWEHYRRSPPRELGAGTLAHLAKQARRTARGQAAPAPAAARADAGHSAGLPDLTEDGVALAFCAEHRGRFVFDHTAGKWSRWVGHREGDARGGRWEHDKRGSAFNAARRFTRALRKAAADAPPAMGKIGFAAAVERASRSDPRMAVSHEVWDADPWLLGVPGGMVDLRTGAMLAPDPARYVSRQTAVAPAAPGTPAPLWSAFLHDATRGDAGSQAFLQRLAGYVLTGDVSEEVLTFLYGPGGNGKGVFLGVLAAILADYAVPVPMEVFTAGSRLNLEYYRAKMAGARLVTASETEAGAAWAESQIKELTGNEVPLSARHPYGQPFDFRPQFKLVIVGNHTPSLKGRSPAMERRLRVVPFRHKPAAPDFDLKDKLRAEYPAILRWMLDGCAMWQRDRLGTAAAIAEATGEYFEGQDTFKHWLAERCELDAGRAEQPGALLLDFNAYAKRNGGATVTASEFKELVDRAPSLRRVTVQGKVIVRGVALRAVQADGPVVERERSPVQVDPSFGVAPDANAPVPALSSERPDAGTGASQGGSGVGEGGTGNRTSARAHARTRVTDVGFSPPPPPTLSPPRPMTPSARSGQPTPCAVPPVADVPIGLGNASLGAGSWAPEPRPLAGLPGGAPFPPPCRCLEPRGVVR